MNITNISLISFLMVFMCGCDNRTEKKSGNGTNKMAQNMNVNIILGSTREGRTSEKIGRALKKMLDARTDIHTEIIDLRDYDLPFLYDAVAPAKQETVTDPVIKKWSDTISTADGFIIVVPEYNSGYPGVLKNALDLLYKEWNNKPVGLVGYSGGPSGGTTTTAQVADVARAFKMVPTSTTINIPNSWKALDSQGSLIDASIETALNAMVDELVKIFKAL
jgi:NAD(P)H-dependent FMN reductase